MLQVTVFLDGLPIPQTPFGVKVGAASLHAPACAVRGLADSCPHGMLEFEVHGRDAFGNSLQLLPRCACALRVHRYLQLPGAQDSKRYLMVLMDGMESWQGTSYRNEHMHTVLIRGIT